MTPEKMSFFSLGECMLELRPTTRGSIQSAYAGDTYNAAIYAKRFCPKLEVGFVSCVGTDPFSQSMLQEMQSEGLSTKWISQTNSAPIGIYSIETDEKGERSFHYWRKHSAASQLMSKLDVKRFTHEVDKNSILLLSGISVAILDIESRNKALALIMSLRNKGVKIAFDPNYRVSLWPSLVDAKTWTDKFFEVSDIVLPGLDEMSDLFQITSKEHIKEFFFAKSVTEIVLKAGKAGSTVITPHTEVFHPFSEAPQQVDSTAAGDSFAGTYLASKCVHRDLKTCLVNASEIAAMVVQHHGAVIDKNAHPIDMQLHNN